MLRIQTETGQKEEWLVVKVSGTVDEWLGKKGRKGLERKV